MISLASQSAQSLQTLLQGFDLFLDDQKISVSGLALDSRQVKEGDLFFAVSGGSQHGKDFIDDAVAKGAVAILSDHAVADCSAPLAVMPDLQKNIGEIASRFFSEPSKQLWVIGVTGTNGKTSVSQFIAQALNDQSVCGVMGTLGYGIPGAMVESTHTTPDPIRLQSLLAEMVEQGAKQVVMEVSSHGLEQSRVAGVQFDVAVFTNLSRDHLDYHLSMEGYAAAKRKLFEVPGLQYGIINAGDAYGRTLLADLSDSFSVIRFAIEGELPEEFGAVELMASDLKFDRQGMRFQLTSDWGGAEVHASLLGRFNVSNLLAVLAVLLVSGVELQDAISRIKKLTTVPGRMELFSEPGMPIVVVDYAHTPDALQHALGALRSHCVGKLWCLFGCGGDRDQGKRPMMGEVAEQLSDQQVVTDDNPRHENAEKIVEQIRQGMKQKVPTVIHDRAAAIEHVIRSANADDVILVAGKGHEEYQQVNDEKRPFSDRELVRTMLKKFSQEVTSNE